MSVMRIYDVVLIGALLAVTLASFAMRRRYRPRCPNCGERDGQRIVSEQEIARRDVVIGERGFGYKWPMPERLSVRRQRFLAGVVKCSKCGKQYEHTWFAQR